MSWNIETIHPEETHRLLPLVGQVQSLHVAAHPDQFRDDTDAGELREHLSGWLRQAGVTGLVALSDGAAVGYAIFAIEDHGPHPLKKPLRRGYLYHIAVDKGWRGLGVGTDLMETMKSHPRAAGVTRLASSYFSFNEASAALMRTAGLEPVSVRAEGML